MISVRHGWIFSYMCTCMFNREMVLGLRVSCSLSSYTLLMLLGGRRPGNAGEAFKNGMSNQSFMPLVGILLHFMSCNHSIFGVRVVRQKFISLSHEGLWHICQAIRDTSVLFARIVDKATSKNDAQACSMLAKSS